MTSSRFRRIATLVVAVLFALSVAAVALSGNSDSPIPGETTAAT